jgi:hypothetical protein
MQHNTTTQQQQQQRLCLSVVRRDPLLLCKQRLKTNDTRCACNFEGYTHKLTKSSRYNENSMESPAAVANDASGAAAATPSGLDTTTKLLNDLKAVTEKMDKCDYLLRRGTSAAAASASSSSSQQQPPTDPPTFVVVADAALMAVVGFLEACAPRMVELVEALSIGDDSVGDEVLIQALSVNDRLTKMVEDMDKMTWPEGAAAAAAAAKPLAPNDPIPAGRKITGEEDLLDFENF